LSAVSHETNILKQEEEEEEDEEEEEEEEELCVHYSNLRFIQFVVLRE
jgi:hypothetical protein